MIKGKKSDISNRTWDTKQHNTPNNTNRWIFSFEKKRLRSENLISIQVAIISSNRKTFYTCKDSRRILPKFSLKMDKIKNSDKT